MEPGDKGGGATVVQGEMMVPGPVEVGRVVRFRIRTENRTSKLCRSTENDVTGRQESRTNPRSFYVVPAEMCSKR